MEREYYLIRPGVGLMGESHKINTPEYPHNYKIPKVGDTVWVIVKSEDDDYAIDTDIIKEISDYGDEKVRQYEWRQSVIEGREPWPLNDFNEKIKIELGTCPTPEEKENYSRDFWLTKYHKRHANDFGDTIYSSFEEAKIIFIQYFMNDIEQFHEILASSEEDLKPDLKIDGEET